MLTEYSTVEKIVGSFNGKDVYEKSYFSNSSNSNNILLDDRDFFKNTNAYAIVAFSGSIKTDGGNIVQLNYYANSSYSTAISSTTTGLRITATGWNIVGYFVTVRYIKS